MSSTESSNQTVKIRRAEKEDIAALLSLLDGLAASRRELAETLSLLPSTPSPNR